MPITVAMIEEKEFKTKMRGYDPVEVDEFLDVLSAAIPAAKAYVAEQIEELGEESQAFDPSF